MAKRTEELKLIIKLDPDDPEVAEVLLDGKLEERDYRFLLDTGAATTSVRYDEYTSKLDASEQNQSSGVFAEGHYDVVTLPRLELGSIVKTDFPVDRMAKGNNDVHNLIGMDVLKAYSCHFLFDERKVVLNPSPESVGGRLQDLFLDSKFHPYIDVQFGNVQANAVWDTGAGVTVVDTRFIEAHPTLFELSGSSVGTDSTGTKLETSEFRMVAPVIGGETFPPHKVVGIDLSRVNASLQTPMDLLLGYTTLSRANWFFDFPSRKWGITKMLGSN